MSETKESFLRADEPIPGQEWCLVSFISPENVLKNKDVFYFQNFLNQYEPQFRTTTLERFLADKINTINETLETRAVEFEKQDLSGVALSCRNAKLRVDETLTSLQTFARENVKETTYDNIKDLYDSFMYLNKSKLDTEFHNQNKFHITTRGLKFRGAYSSQEEAAFYADKLIKKDDTTNIYTIKVGQWIPWDPSDAELKNVDTVYQQQDLNTLMREYKKNEDARETFINDKINRNKNRTIDNMSGPSSKNDNMFNTVGDLALQRKLESTNKN